MKYLILKRKKILRVSSVPHNFKNLVKEPTCFKNTNNPTCIDLILTNKPSYFQTTTVIETGISDFHKLTVTVLKSSFRKQEPKISVIEITKSLTTKISGTTCSVR